MSQKPSKGLMTVMKLANSIHVGLYRISRGKFANQIANLPLLLLTTQGRKSGKPHTHPVVYIRDGKDYLISASAGGMPFNPAWYYNLRDDPNVKILIGSQPMTAHAVVAKGDERNRLYEKFKAASPNFVKYEKNTNRVIPVIRLTPQ
jgi:deazaflavin-dependent oxidoreductase (nitroreductase family)